ncbi:MAG: IclR family transcriptional regulator [Pseudomonadota bacterium]
MASADPKGSSVQSLSRAFGLLLQLAETRTGLTLVDLANRCELAPSTAHRLLNSMRALGFVDLDESSGFWSVGLAAFEVGSAYVNRQDFIAEARPVLKSLVQQTGETANLAVLHGGRHVFVAQVECQQVMRMVAQLGKPGAAHASGVGKALLSALSPPDLEAVVSRHGLPELTAHTITNNAAFRVELRRIRNQGYAVDDQEQLLGMRCVAANVYDDTGSAVAAMSISGPSIRLDDDRIETISHIVRAAAADVTQKIGGKAA